MVQRKIWVLAIAVCIVFGVFIARKGITVRILADPSKELERILGPAAMPWLEQAEIVAWQPDLNFKPQSYFIVCPMSEESFRSWAVPIQLHLIDSAHAQSNIFILPEGLRLHHWLNAEEKGIFRLDAEGSIPRAMIWSRWQSGTAYTVVHPI